MDWVVAGLHVYLLNTDRSLDNHLVVTGTAGQEVSMGIQRLCPLTWKSRIFSLVQGYFLEFLYLHLRIDLNPLCPGLGCPLCMLASKHLGIKYPAPVRGWGNSAVIQDQKDYNYNRPTVQYTIVRPGLLRWVIHLG